MAGTEIRSFNRYELKYLLDVDFAQEVMKRLEDYMTPDAHGDKYGNYVLSSLYYDSDDFKFYWEKVEGLRFRRKLRIRLYEDGKKVTDDTKMYVEIKQRLDRVTQKRRIVLPYKKAIQFCDEHKMPELKDEKDQLFAEEMFSMIKQYDLRPQCITSYHRRAFNGSQYDPGLRVTFDTNLRYRRNNLDLATPQLGPFMLSPNQSVMEIKVNDRIPYWLTELAADRGFQLIRVSKYCTGLEQAELVPRSNYIFA